MSKFFPNTFLEFLLQEDTEIRYLSLKLFGELANVSHMDSFSFSEQVGRNLICLLFHLGEKEPIIVQVRIPLFLFLRFFRVVLHLQFCQACKFSLRSIAPVIKSLTLSNMIQKHLIDDGKLHYQEYITKVAEILVSIRHSQEVFAAVINFLKFSVYSRLLNYLNLLTITS